MHRHESACLPCDRLSRSSGLNYSTRAGAAAGAEIVIGSGVPVTTALSILTPTPITSARPETNRSLALLENSSRSPLDAAKNKMSSTATVVKKLPTTPPAPPNVSPFTLCQHRSPSVSCRCFAMKFQSRFWKCSSNSCCFSSAAWASSSATTRVDFSRYISKAGSSAQTTWFRSSGFVGRRWFKRSNSWRYCCLLCL